MADFFLELKISCEELKNRTGKKTQMIAKFFWDYYCLRDVIFQFKE